MNFISIIILVIIGVGLYKLFKRHIIQKKIEKIDLSILPEEFVIIDLETTGLSATNDEIIEIGAIRAYRDSDYHDTFETLVKPSIPIPSIITKITGISQKMVDDEGVELEEALRDFLEFIGDRRLVAYNMRFDIKFLRNAVKKIGMKITNPTSCALVMARRAWPGLKSYKLTELAKIGGFDTSSSHRALYDCEITMRVYTTAAVELGSIH